MRQSFTLALGVNLRGASLADGTPAYGASIDNPSGYWLQLYPGGGYVPPYRMGWATTFPQGAPQVDVLFAPVGPAGQVSTAGGEKPVVLLFSAAEAPADDQGAPFIEAFTPILTVDSGSITAAAVVVLAFVPAIPTKRFRAYSFRVVRQGAFGGACIVAVEDSAAKVYDRFALFMDQARATSDYPQGLDFPTGEPINLRYFSLLNTLNAPIRVIATYSIL